MDSFRTLNRSSESEILDDPSVPQTQRIKAYQQLQTTHDWLGNTRAIVRLLQSDPLPIGRVLDIGCSHGALLRRVKLQLGVQVIGFDLSPAPADASVPITMGNAVTDTLPLADVALAVCMAHHISEPDLIRLIRNVSRSCRRLILLDLVRHWMPLLLFRSFVSPFLSDLNAQDGVTSLQRSYTPLELRSIVDRALEGGTGRAQYIVAPFNIRQVVDISW